MKKLIIMSIMLANVSLDRSPGYATVDECTPDRIVPLLRAGSVQNQFFVSGGKSYAAYINDKTQSFLDDKTRKELGDAQVSNTHTQWFPSANPANAYCDIHITHHDQTITKIQLYPPNTTLIPKY